MELPAHEVLQSLQTLLSSSQIAVPSTSISAGIQPKSSSTSDQSAPTPPDYNENGPPLPNTASAASVAIAAAAINGPPTPTHSERLEADFRRGTNI
jgi:hypothetical protein